MAISTFENIYVTLNDVLTLAFRCLFVVHKLVVHSEAAERTEILTVVLLIAVDHWYIGSRSFRSQDIQVPFYIRCRVKPNTFILGNGCSYAKRPSLKVKVTVFRI